MTTPYRQVHNALQQKLGVTPRAVNMRKAKLQALVGMPDDVALYVEAQREGVPFHKWVKDADLLAQVASFAERVAAKEARARAKPTSAASSTPTPRRGRSATESTVAFTIAGVSIGTLPGLKPSHAREAKVMAEKVYPALYIFENSVRDIIERVLEAEFGADWWTKAVPPKARQKADEHKAGEKTDPWHGRRGNRELDYLLLSQLWDIIKHHWPRFAPFFPDQAWVQTIITRDMNVSRRVLAHMNPLSADDISNVENAFRKWAKQLQAVATQLP
jgi:hypothetical protein